MQAPLQQPANREVGSAGMTSLSPRSKLLPTAFGYTETALRTRMWPWQPMRVNRRQPSLDFLSRCCCLWTRRGYRIRGIKGVTNPSSRPS
ncbi:hypothetical protein PC121_g9480 [Phytophthora cactorum]|nr:hypothetical protein PC121_g9480 [Phytophthora cactorum]KAG4050028.1 hypothetical protein PC123_g14708 [Phytophthora cactorum]